MDTPTAAALTIPTRAEIWRALAADCQGVARERYAAHLFRQGDWLTAAAVRFQLRARRLERERTP